MIPEFIARLREQIGHDSLLLVGVTAVVLRTLTPGASEVLLVREHGNAEWTAVNGIMEPSEQPHETAVREAREEAGVRIAPRWISAVRTAPERSFANGDRAVFLNLVFQCEWLSGELVPTDDEVAEAGWFSTTALPPTSAETQAQIAVSRSVQASAWFGTTLFGA